MLRTKGFIELSMMAWGAIAAGVVIAALSGLLWIQTARLDSCQRDYATYKGGVEALGREAQKEALEKDMWNKLNKEKTDAEIKAGRAGNAADAKRVRDNVAGGRFVPEAAPRACGPAGAGVNWADADAAIRDFAAETAGQIAEGTDAVGALDALKRKAQSGGN